MSEIDQHQQHRPPASKGHGVVASVCALLVLSMAGLSFAAVPLYRLYCQVTGYQGTTQKAERASDLVLDRVVKVHFDANTAAELPWTFEPMQSSLEVKVGENTLAFYKATNTSDRPTTGTAVFNVTPDSVGSHFNKVQCFCFTEQVLQPGETVQMPVSFYVDPAILDDPEGRFVHEITLGYTFYEIDLPEEAHAALDAASGPLTAAAPASID